MASNTIDIIYRFIADTKQLDQQLKTAGKDIDFSNVKLPDMAAFEKYMKGVNNEITRLSKTGQITVEQATKLKQEYGEAKKNLAEMAKLIASRPAGTRPSDPRAASYGPTRTPADIAEGERLTRDAALYDKAYSNVFQRTKRGTIDLRTGLRATAADFKKFGQLSTEELEKLANSTQKPVRSFKELGKQISTLVRDFRGFARIGSSLTQIGTTLTIMGAGITGGIFKSATDFIKQQEELGQSTATTREWAKQMERVKEANSRIGAVMATSVLPLLKQGADILGKFATFIEQHPAAVAAALKTGLVLTGVGAITAAVGKGITLVTDAAFLAASLNIITGGEEMAAASVGMNAAADKMIVASKATGIGSGTGIVKWLGTAGGILGDLAIPLGVLTAAVYGADKAFDKITGQDVKWADYVKTFKQSLAIDAFKLGTDFSKSWQGKLFGATPDTGQKWFEKVAKALGLIKDPANEAADSLSGLSDVLKNSLKREEVLKAYEEYKADELDAVRKLNADKKKLDDDARAATLKANADLAKGIADAYAKEQKSLAAAARDYDKANAKADQKLAEDIAKEKQKARDDQLKIEQDLQEKLRKLKQDYQDRETELLAARDAVGLVKNRQKYIQDQAEARSEAAKQLAEQRRNVQERIAELKQQYLEEKAQRAQDYKDKIAEIQQQAKDEIEQLRQKNAEELRQIQVDRNNKLKELDATFKAEHDRRINAFLAQVRELDAALLGQLNTQKKYHDEMLKELDAFLARYRNGMGTLLQAPGRQVGGYVQAGLYRMHDNEFVLNAGTTSALEQMFGRKLSQAGVLQMASSTVRSQVVWNDSRRFDSSLQPADRRALNNDTLDLLSSVVGRR